jgi:hypothetical protein
MLNKEISFFFRLVTSLYTSMPETDSLWLCKTIDSLLWTEQFKNVPIFSRHNLWNLVDVNQSGSPCAPVSYALLKNVDSQSVVEWNMTRVLVWQRVGYS